MSYQKIIIIGNLGREPEMRYTPSGQAVTSFSVAVNETYTNANGEKVKKTIWFRVTTWGKQAETCNQYLKKGQQVLVDGRMNADPATGGPKIFTRQDGTAGSSFEITAQTVRFLSSRVEGESGPIAGGGGMEMAELPPEDEIPF
ncbi:MAG: single-stranded DNA-binding protein [Anaerolineales bacterium]|jgi:single-strand DNA-binding protein|nr:single-stranded DNA-binding protein [Chloroflexota bacterium]MBK6644294.1 single-stranded DNA-binding protein [Anaerolineales bacterium]MCC6985780.1 single-stranded DNA-binding protein [Anaerolineales bacterium]